MSESEQEVAAFFDNLISGDLLVRTVGETGEVLLSLTPLGNALLESENVQRAGLLI